MASNLALSSGVRTLFPLVRTDHVFFGVMEDGTIDTALTDRDLTETERAADLKATAWRYVKVCEGYSYADAKYNYDACRAMSDRPVREAFEAKWFLPNGKDAPESPQKLFGKNGQIDVIKIKHPFFVRENVIQVTFKRVAWKYDGAPPQPSWGCKPPSCSTWTATIDFTLLDRMPAGSQDDNALKFYAIRYQLSEGAS
jgi:type IV secretion system protein VirB8